MRGLVEQLEIERQERADFEASQAKLLEQLETLRTALWEIADRPVEESQRNAWTREMQACARDALNPAKSPGECSVWADLDAGSKGSAKPASSGVQNNLTDDFVPGGGDAA